MNHLLRNRLFENQSVEQRQTRRHNRRPEPKDIMRETWPVEPRGKLLKDLEAADAESRESRLERLEFLLGEFGTPAGMMLTGGIGAVIAIGELRSSFLNGNFMATVLCCQTFIEHSLAGGYALSGQDALVEIGFKDLIHRSLADGNLSVELAASLHELREMRNPYNCKAWGDDIGSCHRGRFRPRDRVRS